MRQTRRQSASPLVTEAAMANCWALEIDEEMCHVIAVFYDLELSMTRTLRVDRLLSPTTGSVHAGAELLRTMAMLPWMHRCGSETSSHQLCPVMPSFRS